MLLSGQTSSLPWTTRLFSGLGARRGLPGMHESHLMGMDGTMIASCKALSGPKKLSPAHRRPQVFRGKCMHLPHTAGTVPWTMELCGTGGLRWKQGTESRACAARQTLQVAGGLMPMPGRSEGWAVIKPAQYRSQLGGKMQYRGSRGGGFGPRYHSRR